MQNTNYPALRTLYETYKAEGFNLIAFPCNQFGGQAPGSSEEERQWAFRKFGFEFDVFVSRPLGLCFVGSLLCGRPGQRA